MVISSLLILGTIVHLKMKMNKRLIIILLFSFSITMVAQQGTNRLSDGVFIEKNQVTEKDKKFIKHYFDGEKYKLLEEYDQAIYNYEQCISIIPEESSPHYQIGKIQLYVFKKTGIAEEYIKTAITLEPTNIWYYYELLAIYGFENNLIKQLLVYDELIDINPEKPEYYYAKIQILRELGEFKKIEKLVKKFEKQHGRSTDLLIELKKTYVHQNNFIDAEKIGQELVQRSPYFYKQLAEIYMHFNDYKGAEQAYINLLTVDRQNQTALIALYTIYLNKKDLKNQQKYLLEIGTNNIISLDIKKEFFYKLLITNDYSKYSNFKEIMEKVIKIHPEEPLFNLILGDIFAKEKQYEIAVQHYQKSLYSGFIKDDYIYNKLIEIYWSKKEFENALHVSNNALERFPLNPIFYYYKSLALSINKEHQLCIESLLAGLELIFDNPNLVSDFYSLLGDSYHNLGNKKDSDESYNQALKHNPNNTLVLNNYSYYLSNRGENLELANEMIIKCIELTKEAPVASYLDTYAWVLYKLKKYKQAKEQIEKAIILNNKSAVIFEHYGDILYELGNISRAIEEWKNAYRLDDTNKGLQQKINKLIR